MKNHPADYITINKLFFDSNETLEQEWKIKLNI